MPARILIVGSLACCLGIASGADNELRLGLDGGLARTDTLRLETATQSASGDVDTRPIRVDFAWLRTLRGVGPGDGILAGAEVQAVRAHGHARGDLEAASATTVDRRALGIDLDLGYGARLGERWRVDGLLFLGYLITDVQVHGIGSGRSIEDDYAVAGWETGLKAGAHYALTAAWSIGVDLRWTFASTSRGDFTGLNGETIRLDSRGIDLGVDAGLRF